MALIRRGKILYFVKRVPKEFEDFDTRRIVQISLKTDSESVAKSKVPDVEAALEAYWVALSTGQGDPRRYEALVKHAAGRGLRYQPLRELYRDVGMGGLLDRIDRLPEPHEQTVPDVAAALGQEDRPAILLSTMPDLWFEMEADAALGKSEDQVRRWKNPRIKAFNNLVEVISDKDIERVTRNDALTFRDWWQKRIQTGLTPNSANKDLSYISSTFRTIIDRKRLPYDNPFPGLKFSEEKSSRPPFSIGWIRENFTMETLSGLNDEARDIFLAMINTGCRPSEICGLLPEDIALDHDIPHIKVRSNAARKLKTVSSKRDLPLVGISLEAIGRHPEGFPRYQGKDKFSDTANKYLRTNKLLETEAHSVYSLRHGFEDRMLALNVPDRLAAELMGHSVQRERYGSGPDLAHKLDVLSRIAV